MEDVQTVPLTAYESMSSRLCRIIRWIITGWALSVVALGLVVVISLSYSDDVVTETVEVAQEADDYGNNTYAGGDYYGSTADGEDYADESISEEGTGDAQTDEQQA